MSLISLHVDICTIYTERNTLRNFTQLLSEVGTLRQVEEYSILFQYKFKEFEIGDTFDCAGI